jgi:hypothetical protein
MYEKIVFFILITNISSENLIIQINHLVDSKTLSQSEDQTIESEKINIDSEKNE